MKRYYLSFASSNPGYKPSEKYKEIVFLGGGRNIRKFRGRRNQPETISFSTTEKQAVVIYKALDMFDFLNARRQMYLVRPITDYYPQRVDKRDELRYTKAWKTKQRTANA